MNIMWLRLESLGCFEFIISSLGMVHDRSGQVRAASMDGKRIGGLVGT